jgi:hypothetical protein
MPNETTDAKTAAAIVAPTDPHEREATWQEVRGARLTLASLRRDLRLARRDKDHDEARELKKAIAHQMARLAEHEPVALAIHRAEVSRED